MPKSFTLFLLLFITQLSSGQTFHLSGKVTNNKLEPLALVSLQVKGLMTGTLTQEDGTFKLELEEGNYDLIITILGYKNQVINFTITKNYTQNIILEAETKNLSEVIVKSKSRDRSEEIIRNVIRNKENVLSAAGAYSCNAYIKAVQQDSSLKKKIKKSFKDSLPKINTDLQQMSMAEISLHYDHETESRIKEERTGVKKRGNPEGLFSLSLTDGNFNVYNNLIRSHTLSEVPFLSPVSYSGLVAYKYKMLNARMQNGKKIYTISVKPRQLSNVTVEGELQIEDRSWVILNAHYSLPGYHIPEYDFFEVDEQYSFVDNKAWMITRQKFTYYSKHGKGKLSGETIVSYKDFELNKSFPKKYFGAEVSATSQNAYEKDSTFWQQIRTEPLSEKEIRFIKYKDSIYRVTKSKVYLDSIDKKINKITWKKLVLSGQNFYDREKGTTWNIMPAVALYQFISFGGARLHVYGSYDKFYKSKKNLNIYADVSYGLRNHDINGNFRVTKLYNPFTRAFYRLEVKRDFQYIFEGDAWINLLRRNNFYLNNAIGVGYGQELANGLFLYTDFDLALRRSLSNYKTNDKFDSTFGNFLGSSQAVAFDPYNAAYGKIRLQYTPFQKYIREPKEKIILGSKWPTFYTMYRKGIPKFLNSKVNFDYLEFGIEQELKLGTAGVSHYTIKSGSFLNTKDLRLVDYQFQRRGDPIFFSNPSEAFQSLDSTFPVFHRFYQGHYLHEFNGAILNKIPILKKLQLKEIAGGGFLIAPERKLCYGELFTGVEKVFKWPFNPLYKFKLGIYAVGSVANQFKNPIQFKIGLTSWDRVRNKWQ